MNELTQNTTELEEILETVSNLPAAGITEEIDPTVPEWAKAAIKPTYTKSEVGLGNVDNVKQYSSTNPPPYPVTSVNNKTGVITLAAEDVSAVPTTRTINGQALASNITLTAANVGAVSTSNALTLTGIDAEGVSHSWTIYGVAQ